MNLNELHGLCQYLEAFLQDYDYEVYEEGVLTLYYQILKGSASRKDFLIFAIKDMVSYIESEQIPGAKSLLLCKFKRIYMK